jgi:transposase
MEYRLTAYLCFIVEIYVLVLNMRYIKGLTKDTLKLLDRIYQCSKYYQVRARVHCIRLSYQGYQISELSQIFKVSRNTIYNWFNSWESLKFAGLYNSPGRGRKKLFNAHQIIQIKNWVKETPKNIEQVQKKVKEEWGIITSKKTIKRVIKSLNMGWYRIKRVVADKPLPELYERKLKELEELKEQEKEGII